MICSSFRYTQDAKSIPMKSLNGDGNMNNNEEEVKKKEDFDEKKIGDDEEEKMKTVTIEIDAGRNQVVFYTPCIVMIQFLWEG